MPKLNGNTGWVITIVLVSLGWVYTLGDRSRSLQGLKEEMSKKADQAYVEQAIKHLDSKLDFIVDHLGKEMVVNK